MKQDDYLIWNGAITVTPPNSVTTLPVLIGENMSESAFRSVSPKLNSLDVVKITKENLVAVAKGLVRKGGPSVKVYTDYFSYGGEHTGQNFRVGDFVVKDYDYTNEREFFRTATLEERKTYGLR